MRAADNLSGRLTIAPKRARTVLPSRTECQPSTANLPGDGHRHINCSSDRRTGGYRHWRAGARSQDFCSATMKSPSLRAEVEALSDRQWELREAEERMKSLLEAQGDLIVRRDGEGRIAYANDAFCALAGAAARTTHRATISPASAGTGRRSVCWPTARASMTRRSTRPAGPRWISWHEVSVRSDSEPATHTQSVGRDVTARALAERELAGAAIRPMPPISQRAVSWRWCRTKSARR